MLGRGGGGAVPNMLPPLAGLALGTPTAVGNDDDEADSDAEHEYERLDQRAHRKFPTLMQPIPMQG